MQKKILKLSDHVIICGCGRMGGVIGDIFRRERVPFTAVGNHAQFGKLAKLLKAR